MADPGFSVGGGGVDSRDSYVSKILYVEMKESGPLGGCAPGQWFSQQNVQFEFSNITQHSVIWS